MDTRKLIMFTRYRSGNKYNNYSIFEKTFKSDFKQDKNKKVKLSRCGYENIIYLCDTAMS